VADIHAVDDEPYGHGCAQGTRRTSWSIDPVAVYSLRGGAHTRAAHCRCRERLQPQADRAELGIDRLYERAVVSARLVVSPVARDLRAALRR